LVLEAVGITLEQGHSRSCSWASAKATVLFLQLPCTGDAVNSLDARPF
jgi:hypothetical protein